MQTYDTERNLLRNRIYDINENDFDTVAIDLCRFQYQYNPLYHSYCNLLGVSPLTIDSIHEIPFLPITMFRDHAVKTGDWEAEKIFRSSGTTGSTRSVHHIRDIDWYHHHAVKGFELHFGDVCEYTWLTLLPSYDERSDSSLIDMVNHFMDLSDNDENSFINDQGKLKGILEHLAIEKKKTILIGVTFALLDFFETNSIENFSDLIIIETGGMKGRGSEITREEVHQRIRKLNPELNMSSEYGMTEMQSQAYMTNNKFSCSQTMKVLIRDITDPLSILSHGQRGAINIIDLANLDTCALIATDDIGSLNFDETFDVIGRLDQSDIRGCNLLLS